MKFPIEWRGATPRGHPEGRVVTPQSKITNPKSKMKHPDLALLAAGLTVMLLLMAVREGLLPDPLPLAAVTPRPTATATASPTPGWWGEVVLATPVLEVL